VKVVNQEVIGQPDVLGRFTAKLVDLSRLGRRADSYPVLERYMERG
jgi:hypothetical protein